MRSGLAFLAGIIVGVVIALGGTRLGWLPPWEMADLSGQVLSLAELDELRQLHARLGVVLMVADQPVVAVRRPVTRTIRLVRTGVILSSARQNTAPGPQAVHKTPASDGPEAELAAAPLVTRVVGNATDPAASISVRNETLVSQPVNRTDTGIARQPVAAASPKSEGLHPKEKIRTDPAKLYADGLAAYEQGRHEHARELFSRFLRDFSNHRLVPNVLYWTGETWYAQGRYAEGSRSFAQVRDRFPGHGKSPDALLKMAYCQIRLGNASQARIYLDELDASYPESNASRLGRQARGRLQGERDSAFQVARRG